MIQKLFIILISIAFSINANAQTTQTIRGTITDKQSKMVLPGAIVAIMSVNPPLGASADMNGIYKLTAVPLGRQVVKITFLGYKEVTIPNVLVTAGKEVVLDIELEEDIRKLNEVVIKADDKHATVNESVTVSGRSFSMEEVNRYSGGRSDPSRLAANFAGVSTPDDSRNDIVVRGNSPTGLLWRIDGLPVPNPNHFATLGTTGGPVSALNTNILKNSDFITSAFPAEYGNANAGVFDIGFKTGNTEKYEHMVQFGAFTGLEALTEGPISKKNNSSYVIGARYSFTGLAHQLGLPIGTAATPNYQDLSFKINFGNSKAGTFTLFGLGGRSDINFLHNEIDSTDLFADASKDSYFKSYVVLSGLSHLIRLSDKTYIKSSIGFSASGNTYREDTIAASDGNATQTLDVKSAQRTYIVSSFINTKVNARFTTKNGILAEVYNISMKNLDRETTPFWSKVWDFNGTTSNIQAYSQNRYRFSDKWSINVGLHGQFLTLNNSWSVEPRGSIVFNAAPGHTLSAGYGLHSQMQALPVYFYQVLLPNGSYSTANRQLDFTRSHHMVLNYEWNFAENWRLKTEGYYQLIFNVPVDNTPSSFSMLNEGSNFAPTNRGNLTNSGTGSNYGVELTIEKFYSKGFYTLITGSLYQSKYKGSDGVERNTAFNNGYVANLLAGKEFLIGKAKRNAITIDFRVVNAGGRYYTPVDLVASQAAGTEVKQGDAYAFSKRYPGYFRMDLKLGIRLNGAKRKLTHTFYFDMQNLTGNKNVFLQRYNTVTNNVNTAYQIGFFPDFMYRIQF